MKGSVDFFLWYNTLITTEIIRKHTPMSYNYFDF